MLVGSPGVFAGCSTALVVHSVVQCSACSGHPTVFLVDSPVELAGCSTALVVHCVVYRSARSGHPPVFLVDSPGEFAGCSAARVVHSANRAAHSAAFVLHAPAVRIVSLSYLLAHLPRYHNFGPSVRDLPLEESAVGFLVQGLHLRPPIRTHPIDPGEPGPLLVFLVPAVLDSYYPMLTYSLSCIGVFQDINTLL